VRGAGFLAMISDLALAGDLATAVLQQCIAAPPYHIQHSDG
jgi:hypothetical protein